MMARDETTGEGMTDGELEDEVMTLMAAGHEVKGKFKVTSWSSLGDDFYRKDLN